MSFLEENPVSGSVLIYMQDLAGGGAERVALLLANGMAHLGHKVTLVLVRREGPFLNHVSPKIEVISLKTERTATAPFELAQIIREKKPDIVLSHLTHVNVSAILAGLLSGYSKRTIVVEHNQFDKNYALIKSIAVKAAYKAVRFLYPQAGALISVSKGVEKTLQRAAHVQHRNSYIVYNPIIHKGVYDKAAMAPEHPWLTGERTIPVAVSVGSLTEQKDFPTFLNALAAANKKQPIRGIIFGEGPERRHLQSLVTALGLTGLVDMPGFTNNPFAAMRACDLYVMSSRWEGLPTVLVEALACEATIVSTDCPSGPREILLEGELGYLCEVGNPDDLAEKIGVALKHKVDPKLMAARAQEFSVANAIENYAVIFDQIAGSETGFKAFLKAG